MFELINRYRFLYVFIVLVLFFLIKAVNEQFGWFKLADILLAVIVVSSLFMFALVHCNAWTNVDFDSFK